MISLDPRWHGNFEISVQLSGVFASGIGKNMRSCLVLFAVEGLLVVYCGH